MYRIFAIGIFCLSFGAEASKVWPKQKLQDVAEKLQKLVARYETMNYYDYAGVHVIKNEHLSKMTLARMTENAFPKAFENCLYNDNSSTHDFFRKDVEIELDGFGKLTWLTDSEEFAKDPGCVFSWKGHLNYEGVEKVLSVADEYGGAGGYLPRCSIVVKTASGFSFLFHAIDTY